MSSVFQAMAVVNDVFFSCRGQGGLLLRVFGALMIPAGLLLFALAILDYGDGSVLSGDLLSAFAGGGGEARPSPILAGLLPPALLLALTSVGLRGAGAILGWQLLHGREPSPRGVLLSLYLRRWRLMGLLAFEFLAYGALLLLALSLLWPLYQGVTGGLASLILSYSWPLMLYGATLPLSFALSLVVPLLVLGDSGLMASLPRALKLLGSRPPLALWGWAASQGVGVLVLLNLWALLMREPLTEGGALLLDLGAISPIEGLLILGLTLLALPLGALIQVGVYQTMSREEGRLSTPGAPSLEQGVA